MKKDVEIDNKAIGQRIRQARESLSLSREELAELLGLSDYYIGQLERGERQMSLSVLIKVVTCLHLSLDFLFFGTQALSYSSVSEKPESYNDYSSTPREEIEQLLQKCSPSELNLFVKILKVLIPYLK